MLVLPPCSYAKLPTMTPALPHPHIPLAHQQPSPPLDGFSSLPLNQFITVAIPHNQQLVYTTSGNYQIPEERQCLYTIARCLTSSGRWRKPCLRHPTPYRPKTTNPTQHPPIAAWTSWSSWSTFRVYSYYV